MFKLFPDENIEPVQPKEVIPLPELLRTQSLENVIGQSHLLGEGKHLRLSFQSGKPHAMIFVGAIRCRKNYSRKIDCYLF